jgi:hypothetical protein
MRRLERVPHGGLVPLVSHVRGSDGAGEDDGARFRPTLPLVCAPFPLGQVSQMKSQTAQLGSIHSVNMGIHVKEPSISLQRCPDMEIRVDTPKG